MLQTVHFSFGLYFNLSLFSNPHDTLTEWLKIDVRFSSLSSFFHLSLLCQMLPILFKCHYLYWCNIYILLFLLKLSNLPSI